MEVAYLAAPPQIFVPTTFSGLAPTEGDSAPSLGLRTLQGWMGHARISTTEIYAASAKDQREVELVENAFAALSHSVSHSEQNRGEPTAAKSG